MNLVNPFIYSSTVDSSFQAWLNKATSLGYTLPSSSQQTILNTLFVSLKANGIWNDIDVAWIFANDGDGNISTLNIKDPNTYQCTKVNSPIFTSNRGFKSNGSTSYLNSNWIPSSGGMTSGNASVAIGQSGTIGTATETPIGLDSNGANTSRIVMAPSFSSQILFGMQTPQALAGTGNVNGAHTYQGTPNGTTLDFYRNNTIVATATRTLATVPTVAVTPLVFNNNGAFFFYTPTNLTYTFFMKNLNSTKRTAFYNIMSNYHTAIGA